MKITERTQIALPKSNLQAFSDRRFTLELNGFEVLALRRISQKIGGVGKVRSVFSYCKPSLGMDNFTTKLDGIEGIGEAQQELETFLEFGERSQITVNDSLGL